MGILVFKTTEPVGYFTEYTDIPINTKAEIAFMAIGNYVCSDLRLYLSTIRMN